MNDWCKLFFYRQMLRLRVQIFGSRSRMIKGSSKRKKIWYVFLQLLKWKVCIQDHLQVRLCSSLQYCKKKINFCGQHFMKSMKSFSVLESFFFKAFKNEFIFRQRLDKAIFRLFYVLEEKYCRKTLLKLFDGILRGQPHFRQEKLTYVSYGN